MTVFFPDEATRVVENLRKRMGFKSLEEVVAFAIRLAEWHQNEKDEESRLIVIKKGKPIVEIEFNPNAFGHKPPGLRIVK
jgi:hypothetical protein